MLLSLLQHPTTRAIIILSPQLLGPADALARCLARPETQRNGAMSSYDPMATAGHNYIDRNSIGHNYIGHALMTPWPRQAQGTTSNIQPHAALASPTPLNYIDRSDDTHMCARARKHTPMPAHPCAHAHTGSHARTHARAHACASTCVYVRTYVRAYTSVDSAGAGHRR